MQTRPFRLLARTAAIGATVLALAGCPEDAADITEIRATSLDFDVAPIGGIAFSGGDLSVDRVILAAFDTTVADAFGRSIAGNQSTHDAAGTDFGPGWNFGGFERNSSTDPRLPAIVEPDAALAADDGFVIGDATESGQGPGTHNPFTEGGISGLLPSTAYVVAFFRFGTTINGELDQGLIARGLPQDAADELVAVGGSPAGDPTVAIEAFPTIIPFQVNANPFVLGMFTTSATGVGAFDVVVDGAGVLADDAMTDDAQFDSSLVARSDDTPTALPRYNYLVVLQGAAVDAVDAANNPHALRIQIGQDFVASTGVPINNAYAPFPILIPDAALVTTPGGAGRPDSITFETIELKELAGGAVWQVWLYNRAESPPTMTPVTTTQERIAIIQIRDPITGEIISEKDSLLAVATTSSFVGQSVVSVTVDGETVVSRVKHRLTISDAIAGAGAEPGSFTDIFLSQEAAPGAAMPADARPVFFQYTDQNGTPTNFFDDASLGGTASFGSFDIADASASRILLDSDFIQSSGLGGVRLATDEEEISVDIRQLPLPPVGFFYAGYTVGVGILVEETAIPMGPLTTVPPDTVSLFDADVDQSIDGVTATGIRFANSRLLLPVGSIVDAQGDAILNTFFLTLEPKLGNNTIIGPTLLEIGALPVATITTRQAGN